MNKKPGLLFYWPGARGDFLYSILFGNILNKCWRNDFIKFPGEPTRKIHLLNGQAIHGDANSINFKENLLEYTTVRISVPTQEQVEAVFVLQKYKQTKFGSFDSTANSKAITEWEEQYKDCDPYCLHVVEFKNLFDIDYLEKLFIEIRNRPLTEEERYRISYNIDLNNGILARYSSMDRTVAS